MNDEDELTRELRIIIKNYIREQEENTWVVWHFVRIEKRLTGFVFRDGKMTFGDRRIHHWKYVVVQKIWTWF